MTADEFKALVRARWTEAEFTAQVLALAKLSGWRSLHLRPARTAKGWRTPVQGDGKGWPDVFLVRGSRLVAAELKVGRNRPTALQGEWLAALGGAGVETHTWTPNQWDEIEGVLR